MATFQSPADAATGAASGAAINEANLRTAAAALTADLNINGRALAGAAAADANGEAVRWEQFAPHTHQADGTGRLAGDAAVAITGELDLGFGLLIRFDVNGTGDRTWTCPAGRGYTFVNMFGYSGGGGSTYRAFRNSTATLISANITFGSAGQGSSCQGIICTVASMTLTAGDTLNVDGGSGGASGTVWALLVPNT